MSAPVRPRDDPLERLGRPLADLLAAEARPGTADAVRAAVERVAAAWARGATWIESGDLDTAALLESGVCGRTPEDGLPLVVEPGGLGFQRCVADELDVVRDLARVQAGVATPGGWAPGAVEVRAARLAAEVAGERPEVAQAVGVALRRGVTLVTGGPGAGKTTAVLRIVAALVRAEVEGAGRAPPRIALAAPTGIAAQRVREAFLQGIPGLAPDPGGAVADVLRAAAGEARTLHRLLGVSGDGLRVRHDRVRPLPCDVVVVDEASMVDLGLMARLAAAVRTGARLVLLGDADQLPAVGAGSCFRDLLDAAGYAGSVVAGSAVRLTGSHRYAAGGDLGRLCEAVRQGDADGSVGLLQRGGAAVGARPLRGGDDVGGLLDGVVRGAWAGLAAREPAAALAQLARLRVLTPHHGGVLGRRAVNRVIRGILFPEREERLQDGELVLVTANDPETGLANGDLGVVLGGGVQRAWFPGVQGPRSCVTGRLPPFLPGYATTVHKAQGAEFGHVILILPDEDDGLLTRDLLFTAASRARERFEVWGGLAVWRAALARRVPRGTGLTWRLGG